MSTVPLAALAVLRLLPLSSPPAGAAPTPAMDPGLQEPPPVASPDTLVVRNVSIVDVEADRILSGRDVTIVEDRIVGVAPSLSSRGVSDGGTPDAESAVRVLDGSGGYLVPGLWDAHVHVESVAGESTLALDIALANGVTTVRDLGTRLDYAGFRNLARRPGPRVVPHGAMIDGPPGAWPGMRTAGTPEEGRIRVREAAAEGWPAVKAYSLLGLETYRAIADEAAKLGLLVVGHIPESVTLEEAVEAGQRGIAHIGRVTQACSTAEMEMVERNREALRAPNPLPALMEVMAGHNRTTLEHWSESRCRDVARRLAEAGVAITPTLMVADFYLGKDPAPDDPRLASVPVDVRDRWGQADFRRAQMTDEMLAEAPEVIAMDWRTVRILHEEGVPILAGTDAAYMNPFIFHGYTLHDELDRLVAVGLTPAAALASATTVPERHFRPEAPVGISPGARADLVLLDRNPLLDIAATRSIRAVVVGGEVLDRGVLDGLRSRVEERAREPIAGTASPQGHPANHPADHPSG